MTGTCLRPDSTSRVDAFEGPLFSPREQLHSAENTMIIFDWDDTLLCSSVVRSGKQKSEEELRELEHIVALILRTAMSLGETLIVTNGNGTWVEDSTRRFLPGLLPIFQEVKAISARAQMEDKHPNDPFMWKQACFEHLLTKERHYHEESGVNLVALGDQFPEIDAARHVGQVIGGPSLVKTVKFKEDPSIAELLGQLYRIEEVLSRIVKEQENQSYGLVQRRLPPDSEHLVARACGWSCSLEEDSAKARCGDSITSIKEVWGLLI